VLSNTASESIVCSWLRITTCYGLLTDTM